MGKYEDFLNLDCKIFNLNNITEELFNLRENFCQNRYKQGIFSCNSCPIWINYYHLGLSCNGALNKYPEECKRIIQSQEAITA